jgi:uncharacterized Zn finger protein
MTIYKLTEAIVRAQANPQSFARGRELYQAGALSQMTLQANLLGGRCEGEQWPFYQVRAELDLGGVRSATCGCSYNSGGYCKHIVALLLAYAQEPEQFIARATSANRLAELDRAQLLALLAKLLDERPELNDWVEAALAAPSAAKPAKAPAPARKKKVDTEVYRRRVHDIMHSLDNMRASEAYWHVGALVEELRGVEKTALEFLNAGDAETALRILFILVKEGHDGFEYVDDSNGELGAFFDGVGAAMAEVILSLELSADEGKDLVSDLNELHRSLSDYGVDGLEVAITAAQYGWNETPNEKRARHVSADAGDYAEEWEEEEETVPAYLQQFASSWQPETTEQKLTRVKLNVLERQERTSEYLALCLKTSAHLRYALKLCELARIPEAVEHALKNFSDADSALKLAERLRESGHLDEAIHVGEHGLQLAGNKAALGQWLAPIEEAQGRSQQSLAAWTAAFRSAPSLALWQTIQQLAENSWDALRPELLAVLEQSFDKYALAEVLLHEQEWDTAIEVAEQNQSNYRLIALVADALIAERPDWVIRASNKQADGLITKAQSKYYTYAAAWLRRVKAAYIAQGQLAEWQQYLQQLKEQYRRRPALLSYLDLL